MRHFILSRWVGNANILSEKAHRMCTIKRRPYKRMALEITGDTKCEMTLVISFSALFVHASKLYIPSTPNNSNKTHTFMCLGRTGRFGQH